MRVPLSWLRDFAPFGDDVEELTATLDDLGLVVEGVERVGAGLEDVVVARVLSVDAIEGADRIRRVMVDAGGDPTEIVCGATNFGVGDLVPLAPVGATLPGGFAIGRRKMKGVWSEGMLCSGRELELGDDHRGLLVLDPEGTAGPGAGGSGPAPGQPLLEALGIEPDVVFDVSVEANRPDAWCIAGVAHDLAARLELAFAVPDRPGPAGKADPSTPAVGPAVDTLAVLSDDDLELCPRITARVATGVRVGPSPDWLARRLTLAGMRPLNNVVDASNYVMLELGQPTHPYDLDRLPGRGLSVRRARSGERLTTLDGVDRELGRPGPGLGDTGEDCLICDAEGTPVGIGGIMGGASSEISETTGSVLLEAAYFAPMAIARTSKRLGLRTEASARFERGTDPDGIDRSAERFVHLLALTAGSDLAVAEGSLDVAGPQVPDPTTVPVRVSRINALLGTDFDGDRIARLLAPIGFTVRSGSGSSGDVLDVTVPTFRPDIRPAPVGEADVAEEVGRIHGYVRLPRRSPSWPQPGRLTDRQRDRRRVREVLAGVAASEAWTPTFVADTDLVAAGPVPPFIEVTNPLVETERWLRATMAPGLVRALAYNAERRQGSLRLFEVGSVFVRDDSAPVGHRSSERLSAVFAASGDDAWAAVTAWWTVVAALRIDGAALEQGSPPPGALHPTRSATAVVVDGAGGRTPSEGGAGTVGAVGELDPAFVEAMGLVGRDGRPPRVGWLDLDLDVLLDPDRAGRRPADARMVSRYPSSDVDLAFVVADGVPAATVAATVRTAGGELLESAALFDVYRGGGVAEGRRSLAYRLRFCADDRTLTDGEVGDLRQACIDAVVAAHGATLR